MNQKMKNNNREIKTFIEGDRYTSVILNALFTKECMTIPAILMRGLCDRFISFECVVKEVM